MSDGTNDGHTQPAGDGGCWGTYVQKFKDMEAEIERLRAEVNMLAQASDAWGQVERLRAELAAANAEVERLRQVECLLIDEAMEAQMEREQLRAELVAARSAAVALLAERDEWKADAERLADLLWGAAADETPRGYLDRCYAALAAHRERIGQ